MSFTDGRDISSFFSSGNSLRLARVLVAIINQEVSEDRGLLGTVGQTGQTQGIDQLNQKLTDEEEL